MCDACLCVVMQNGAVLTLSKRIRWLPDVTSTNAAAKATAQRQVVNTIIQGSASAQLALTM